MFHGNSINYFVKAINKAQEQYVPTTYPEAQFPTLDSSTVHLLTSIGRIAIDNKNELGSPLPAPQLIEDESFSVRIHSYSKRMVNIRMMDKYGWWIVRGGSWCQVDIQSCPPAHLEWQPNELPAPLRQNQPSRIKSNRNIRNGCSRCGRDSHSVKDCFARTNVNGQALDSFDSESDSS